MNHESQVPAMWLLVKTLAPSEPQNSWDLWMFIPLELIIIGFDPPPCSDIFPTLGFLKPSRYEVVLADSDARMAMTAISWHKKQPEIAEA